MRIKPKSGSHLPVLIKLMEITKGDVLELGMGYFSTPYLHWKCTNDRRNLVSFENNESFYKLFVDAEYSNEYHQICFINDWDKADIEKDWDVALIDHSPAGRRRADMLRLKNSVKYLIVHDTEWDQDRRYHYKEIWHEFKYRYVYPNLKPKTSVVSNIIDVTKLKI